MKTEITVTEAMELLNVSKQTIYNYVDKGYLTLIKREISGRVFLDKAQVLKVKEAI